MRRLKKLTFKQLWEKIKRNWKVQYRFVVKNVETHEEKLTFHLSIHRLFVVVTVSAFALVALTAMLIAFTPLRVYVPGYTTPDEYRKYKKLASKIDAVDKQIAINQQYIDNLTKVLNDEIIVEDEENLPSERVQKKQLKRPEERDWIEAAADKILHGGRTASALPLNERATLSSFKPQLPANGVLVTGFDSQNNHYGVDIRNEKNTLVCAIDKGVVVFSGYDPIAGNTIIIQHSGNIVSKYQRNSTLLKTVGAQVAAGEPIARMGNSGVNEQEVHLHFELWYEGVPLNPADYLPIMEAREN